MDALAQSEHWDSKLAHFGSDRLAAGRLALAEELARAVVEPGQLLVAEYYSSDSLCTADKLAMLLWLEAGWSTHS